MKIKYLALAVALAAGSVANIQASNDPQMDAFISNLMSKMTLQEKIGQLNLPGAGEIVTGEKQNTGGNDMFKDGKVGGVFNLKGVDKVRAVQKLAVEGSRLHIPLIFGMDVIHGYETVFPIPLAMSCTWDMNAIETSARIAALESTADGICWTFSPMTDICREPRWGRMSEGAGEDPFLGAAIARAMVKGYQGKSLKDNETMMACVKHFALYGAPEAGRDYNTVDMSRQCMFNYYFEPYKAAAEVGAGSYMASFNVVDGIPATGNRWLMTEVLRNKWKFDGFVVTDYTGISEMIDHGMGDLQQVSALALKAGIDMDMVAEGLLGTLEKSLKEGKVTMAEIDQACRRVLEAKYKLGLFDDPYKYCDENRAKTQIFTKEHRAIARDIATKSFVLLKNEGNVLPLKKSGKIALIGPLANTKANMPGTWSVAAVSDRYKSLLEGMKDAVGNKAEILYAKGSNLCYDETLEANSTMFGREMRDARTPEAMRAEAIEIAKKADVIVFAGGESSESSGESSSRSQLETYDAQHDLLVELKKLGKPIVMLNFAGRSTILNWEQENLPAILNVWFGGSEAADAICDVVFGDKVPSGKLTTSMPRSVGQLPLYYNHLPTGRPLPEGKWFTKFRSNYLDVPNDPLYPFGYGLSYTKFNYSDLTLSTPEMTEQGEVIASVTVTNAGNYDADEIVQLYIHDPVARVSRPVKELKGFKRISLKKGESKTVEFVITTDLLKYYDSDLNYGCDAGEFEVMVGPNSHDVKMQKFTLK
ncbi:MAG: beta-glucosidase BglX [Muribaculaceae bacterium]|nr:beta-glucosidase BglX [Muribaculaceae bacterium]